MGLVVLFSPVLPAAGPLYDDIFPLYPDTSIRSHSETVCAFLTFSPFGPESPLRPGKPGGPCEKQSKRMNNVKCIPPFHRLVEFDDLDIPLGLEDHLGRGILGDLARPVKQYNSFKFMTAVLPAGSTPIIHPSSSGPCARERLPWHLTDGNGKRIDVPFMLKSLLEKGLGRPWKFSPVESGRADPRLK